VYVNMGEILAPIRVVCDANDNIYVCDTYIPWVTKFDKNGNFLTAYGNYSTFQKDVAINALNDLVYTISLGAVNVYDSSGLLLRQISVPTASCITITNNNVMYVGNTSGIVMFNISTVPETIISIFGISPKFLRFDQFNKTLFADKAGDGSSFLYIYTANGTLISNYTTLAIDIFFDKYGNSFDLIQGTNGQTLNIYNSAGNYIGIVTGIPGGVFTITSDATLVVGTKNSAIIPAELPIKYSTSSSSNHKENTGSSTEFCSLRYLLLLGFIVFLLINM